MKILIVCSGNVIDFKFEIHQAFIHEQIEAIKKIYNIEYDTLFIKGKGIFGYLKNLFVLRIFVLRKKIKNYLPDFVHAHFGLSGLLAVLQRKVPVVITFHGSDANHPVIKNLSKVAAYLSHYNIFVSDKIHSKIGIIKKFSIIPCGINFDKFYPVNMEYTRDTQNLDLNKKFILFASGFDNSVKNVPLALSAIKSLDKPVELIELKNKSREQVNFLLNACNLLLLTSISEGSPQIIKEAMACNCPIVATDVGDTRDVISGTEGCYITSFDPEDVAAKIKLALDFGRRTNGREKINHFDNKIIAEKVYNIYEQVINDQK